MEGVCKGEYLEHIPGNEPLKLTRCFSCGFLQLYETPMGGGLSVGDIFLSLRLFCIFASLFSA